jgi:hypothetical protein
MTVRATAGGLDTEADAADAALLPCVGCAACATLVLALVSRLQMAQDAARGAPKRSR